MACALNGTSFAQMAVKQLPSNVNFDRVLEKTKPELRDSGQEKTRDSEHESAKNGTLINTILAEAPNFYKNNGTSVSSNSRFIKFLPCESADWLQENHPNAFLLLCLIAKRARRVNGHPDGLEIGMAQIGDYKTAGIETEKKYRVAKEVLVRIGAIKIIETARNRKKRATEMATRTATNGTLVSILKSDIWDINAEDDGDRKGDTKGDRRATEGRPKGDEQERKKNDKNEERTYLDDVAVAPDDKKKSVSSFRKRKKVEPEIPIERDKGILTTETAHKKLLEDRGSEEIVKQIYSEMAVWKAENGIEGGNDFKTAKNWSVKPQYQRKTYSNPQPKYNHDDTPSNPRKSISFAEEV